MKQCDKAVDAFLAGNNNETFLNDDHMMSNILLNDI